MGLLSGVLFFILGAFTGTITKFLSECAGSKEGHGTLFSCPAGSTLPEKFSLKARIMTGDGRARFIQGKGVQFLWTGLFTGCSFVLIYYHFGLNPDLFLSLFYFSLLMLISLIDLKKRLILNKLVLPSIFVALLFSLFNSSFTIAPSIFSALGGAFLGLLVFTVIYIVSRGGLGEGDLKLALLAGAILGFPVIIVGTALSFILSGLTAIGILALRRSNRKGSIPFAPFMSAAIILSLMFGQSIINWYLSPLTG